MQRLHLVFGGERVTPGKTQFKNADDLHIVGPLPTYETAFNAWKSAAQRTVDTAHMRYFSADLHRLRNEGTSASSTQVLG